MGKIYNMHLYETIMAGLSEKFLNEKSNKIDKYEMSIDEDIFMLYIGDPCYILPKDLYKKYILDRDKGQGLLPDGLGIFHGTYIGDGGYPSEVCKREYGVDSGDIAIITGGGVFNGRLRNEKNVREFEMDGKKHKISLTYKPDGTFIFKLDGKIIEQIYTGLVDNDGNKVSE